MLENINIIETFINNELSLNIIIIIIYKTIILIIISTSIIYIYNYFLSFYKLIFHIRFQID